MWYEEKVSNFEIAVAKLKDTLLQMAKTAREQFCHVEVISVQYSHKTQQHILNRANSRSPWGCRRNTPTPGSKVSKH